ILGFDITDPFNVVHITSPNISGGTYSFADNQSNAREYIVLATTQFKTPASIVQDTPSDLKNTLNGADYIIIAHDSFTSTVQSLATFRQAQGLRVKVVAVQDVYDEFNDGVLDPQAIRNFLAYAYSNWTPPAPSMVLLVGDAHFDPRGYCVTISKCPQDGGINTPPNSIFIPAPLRIVDSNRYESADDNFYVAFNDGSGNFLPQMALGRLPANSAAEVAEMINKIVTYEQNTPAGTWRSRISFVADNAYNANGTPDSGGNFWAYSDDVVAYLPSGYQANRVYYNPCDPNAYPQCALPYSYYTTTVTTRNATLDAINQGSVIVNYVGH
ncbi:MAG: C25 family cysteine peptidase, partial [Anaerolineae bacterium]|nr:C25 family cysteine peptidase [Anaerolineae bacterium]